MSYKLRQKKRKFERYFPMSKSREINKRNKERDRKKQKEREREREREREQEKYIYR